MATWDDSPIKKKRKKKTCQTPKQCFIHITESKEDVSPFTQISWKVLSKHFYFL